MAKPWVFSFTPTELWEELEKLADANHQQFHEGLSRNPPSKGGNQKNVNSTQSEDCAICLSFGHTNRAKSHSTENHWWNKTDAERVAQEASKDPPKALSRRWMKIANRRPAEKVKAVKASRLLEARETRANPAKDALQKILKMEMVSRILPRVMVEKAIFPREKANPVASSGDIPRE